MPLLFETRSNRLLADIVVVTCSQSQQLERLQHRGGLTAEAALQRINAQMPVAAKVAGATFVVDNSGNTDTTRAQVCCRFCLPWLRRAWGRGHLASSRVCCKPLRSLDQNVAQLPTQT